MLIKRTAVPRSADCTTAHGVQHQPEIWSNSLLRILNLSWNLVKFATTNRWRHQKYLTHERYCLPHHWVEKEFHLDIDLGKKLKTVRLLFLTKK